MNRILWLLTALIALPISCSARAARPAAELYRDKWGVPTVVAKALPDAAYGLGYAMAQDNAIQMARNYKQARGRVAEVDGRSALLTDGFIRSLGIEEMAERYAATYRGEVKDAIESFCAGANRALAEQKGKLPGWIEPFTPVDVLSLSQLVNAAFALMDVGRQLVPGMGSNQFAVSAKRSATGHAILSIDPHLPWDGLLAWYEFGLETPAFRFRGITFNGLPFGVMGHTERVAWCMTNNDPDLFDFYSVKTNPANPKQYSYHGEWRDYEDVQLELRYRDGEELKTQRQRTRRTAWGPLIPLRPQAVAFTMLDSWDLLEQTVRMARAKDAVELHKALQTRGPSMWNIVYADTKGNIGYQYNARIPRRDPAFDWTKAVPGDDPRTKWGTLWTADDLPHVENPASGILVNANSAPWLTPAGPGIRADGWPRDVTTYGSTTRYERLTELLKGKPRVTVTEAKRIATDTLVPRGRQAVALLLKWYEKEQAVGKPADSADPLLRILAKWDGRADVDSVGAPVFYLWLRADPQMASLIRSAAWSTEQGEAAWKALGMAADEMKRVGIAPDSSWGSFHVSRRNREETPVSGFNAPRGDLAAVVPNNGNFGDGKVICSVGSSFRMIVHLDPKRVESWSVLPFGESQDPTRTHFGDQAALFGKGEYKETRFGQAKPGATGFARTVLER